MLGVSFDYAFLPTDGTRGGILVAWRSATWCASQVHLSPNALTLRLLLLLNASTWWIAIVYGPPNEQDKVAFLDELGRIRSHQIGPWLLCGDFNLIYQASDKNNHRLNCRLMHTFRLYL
jgi:hypothetical protein